MERRGDHMPTGYTYQIEDGTITTLPAFAILCARAFGATAMMRDEPLDAPIPEEFAPSDYSTKALETAKAALLEAEAMTPEQALAQARESHHRNMASYRESVAKRDATNGRYAAIRAEVEAWTPPTPDHVGLKVFMLEQIDTSVDTYEPAVPEPVSAEEWRRNAIECAKHDIAYHTKGDAEERARAALRTKWVRDLRESLK